MQRQLAIDGIENIRDLGGYTTSNGGQTRWRSFLRADHSQLWTRAALEALIDYGVKLVIDLRAPHEVQALPNAFARFGQVIYLNLPLMPDDVHNGTPFQSLLNTMEDSHEMYAFMFDKCKKPIGEIFTAIATLHLRTTLFHCHGGKDRTGLIAALLLSLVDVDDDAIAQDYALTSEYLREHIAKERLQAVEMGEDIARFDLLSISTKQSMRTTLNDFRRQYGDTQTYLQACGVSKTHIDVVRALTVD